MTGPFPPFVPFVTLLMAPSASINACVVYHLSEQTAWPPRQQTVLLQEGEDHFSGLGTSHRAVDQNGENLRARVIHHKAGIQKPMGKHQFGPAMAGGRTVLLRDRGDEEPARHREDQAHPAQRKAGGGAQGAGAQRLSSYSCLCWGCASLSWRGQSTAPAGWETGPLVVQVNLLAPGIQMMALLQTITELLCLASAGGSWTHYLPSDVPFHLRPGSACKGNTQPDTSKTGGGGECLYGKSYKNATFPWGETCYMRF